MPGHDRVWTARSFLQSRLTKIEPKSRLAHFRIGAVAAEATSCQDRLNVLIKIDGPATTGYRRLVAAEKTETKDNSSEQ
jgi:hypothetical protein